MNFQKRLHNCQTAWHLHFSSFFSPLLFVSTLAFWMLASFSAEAQSYVFTGASGVNLEWSNPDNWDVNGYPGVLLSAGQSVSVQSNCTMDVDITSAGNITIAASMTLTIYFSKTLTNQGTLLNNGTLNFTTTGALSNETTGTFNNQGVIDLNGTLTNFGAFDNHLTFNVHADGDFFNTDGTFNNHATLTNNGTVDNKSGGSFTNLSGATIHHNDGQFLTQNAGSLTSNAGTFNSADFFDVNDNGAFSNSGVFSNSSTLDINASFTIATGGTLTNTGGIQIGGAGSLTNNGTLTNSTGNINDSGTLINNNIFNNQATATLTIGAGKLLENNDTLNNYNTFNVNGICKTKSGGTTTNHATLNVGATGQFIVDGGTAINNSTTLTNNGYVEIKNGGTLTNPTGSSITNNKQVVILNNGTLTNGGSFSSSDYLGVYAGGAFTNAGSLTNSNNLDLDGAFNNQEGANVNNTGNLQIGSSGNLTNSGIVTNLTGGNLNNAGAFSNNHNLINNDTLIIGANKTLNNNDSIYNDGVVIVHGTLKNNGGAALTNDSTVNVTASGLLVVDSAIFKNNSLLTSSGGIEVKRHALVTNFAGATITNSGQAQIASSSILNNQDTMLTSDYFSVMTNGVLNNHAVLTNTGDFDLTATLNNLASGTLNNAAFFHNTSAGTLLNDGKIHNLNGMFLQNGIFNNNELFDNNDTLLIGAGKTMNNNDSLYNDGIVINHGTLKNNGGAAITNDSIVNVSASGLLVIDSAMLKNNSQLTSSGGIEAKNHALVTNLTGATITNDGQAQIASLSILNNQGTLLTSDYFTVMTGGVLNNHAVLTNTADFDLDATLNNSASGTVNNSANFQNTNAGILINNGIVNNLAGTFTQSGIFNNNLLFDNHATFLISAGKTMNNNGHFENDGTCTFSGTLNNNSGATFDNDSTLTIVAAGNFISVNATLTNTDSIACDGSLDIKSGSTLTNAAAATLGNTGQLNVHDTATQFTNAGSVSNSDLLSVYDNANFSNTGGVTNTATFDLGSTMTNQASGVVTNSGTFQITDSGNLTNAGNILNQAAGTLNQTGAFTNNSQLTNAGTFIIAASKTFNNNGVVANSGTLNDNGTFNNNTGASMTNTGAVAVGSNGKLFVIGSTVTNAGTVNVQFLLEIKSGGTFTNQAGAMLSNDGQCLVFDATSLLYNAGTVNNFDFVNNFSDGVVTNAGIFNNKSTGSMDNNGVFTNLAGDTLVNEGTFNNASGTPMLNHGTLLNAATGNFQNNGTLTNNGSLNNNGTVGNSANKTITNNGTLLNANVLNTTGTVKTTATGSLANANGTITVHAGGSLVAEGALLTNSALIANSGMVEVKASGSFSNQTGGTLTNANQFVVNGTSSVSNTGAFSNLDFVFVENGSSFSNSALVTNNGSFDAGGTFNNAAGATLTNAAGTFDVKGGALMTNLSQVTNAAGATFINSGTVIDNDTITNLGTFTNTGILKGTGVYQGTLANNTTGTVAPGASPGTLTVDGDFSNFGIVEIELGGTDPGEYDTLTIAEVANLGATLQVNLVNGFVPVVGDTFTILTADSIAEQFAEVNFPSVAGISWTIHYTDTTVMIATQISLPACTNLTSPVNGATDVTVTTALTWASATGIVAGYRLNVGTTSGGSDILINFDAGNVTTYDPPGNFPYNTTIYVQITPYNSTGDAIGCTEESFTTQTIFPGCTTLTSPSNNATDVAVTTALTWAAATGNPNGYRLDVGTTSGGTDILNNFDAGNVTTYNPPGDFPYNTTIFVKITPYNASGDASGCTEESFTTQTILPACTILTSPANGATNVSVTSALTWAAATGNPTGYRLDVGTTSGGTDILNNFDAGNVTTYNPAGNFPYSTIIYVKITPYNANGDASGCTEESFTTQIAPPACTNLTSPASGATNVAITAALTWAAATGSPTGYRLDVGTTPGGTEILNNEDVGNVTTYNPSGDFPYNTIIYVKIKPYNGTGSASGCTEESFTTQIAPPACTNLTSPANGATNVAITAALTWAAATGSPTGYRLDVGTTPGGTEILNNEDVGNVTTYNPSGDFPYNTIIYVKIKPYNGTGSASGCTEESFTTQIAPPACTNLTSPANGATNVAITAALTWAAATGSPTGYRLDVGTTSGGTDILNNFDAGNVTTYNPPGDFSYNTIIYVKVKPYNGTGSASGCTEESFTTQIAPPACTNLTSPANGATNVAITAALTWAAATGNPTGYRLNVGTTSGGTDILNNFDAGNVTTYNPPGNFPFGTTIFVKITPYHATGNASGCTEESFTTEGSPPACTNLTSPANGATNVAITAALTWAAATGNPTGYRLNVGTTSGGTDILNNFDAGNVTTYNPPGDFPFNTAIYVKITPYNATGSASGCTEESFTTQSNAPSCTNLTSPANGATNVALTAALTWEDATGSPTGYRLDVGTTSGGTDILNNFDAGNVTTYNPPGNFPNNTTIYVKIKPYNASGSATGCVEESFTTQICIPDLSIDNMVVPSGTYHSQGELTSSVATVSLGSNVIFKSDTGILLETVFTVQLGATFDALIQTCPTNLNEGILEEK